MPFQRLLVHRRGLFFLFLVVEQVSVSCLVIGVRCQWMSVECVEFV